MPSKKSGEKLKYLVVILAAGAVLAFYFLYAERNKALPPLTTEKHQTGYKEEDRKNLEQLIHQEGRND